jgi:shikimate kinase
MRLTITSRRNWQGRRGRGISLRKIKVSGANQAAIWNRNTMNEAATHDTAVAPQEAALLAALGRRSIVLVGMMGAGKSSIGRRLAQRLGVGFVDADAEIEAAAGMTIAEIFSSYGEPDFRSGEARVIARLLDQGQQVLATGGGAFMNPETRASVRQKGVSVWLKADFEVLVRRVKRRATADRPMLQGDPAQRIRQLMDERNPVYAEADVTVESREVSHEIIVGEIISELGRVLGVVSTPANVAEVT